MIVVSSELSRDVEDAEDAEDDVFVALLQLTLQFRNVLTGNICVVKLREEDGIVRRLRYKTKGNSDRSSGNLAATCEAQQASKHACTSATNTRVQNASQSPLPHVSTPITTTTLLSVRPICSILLTSSSSPPPLAFYSLASSCSLCSSLHVTTMINSLTFEDHQMLKTLLVGSTDTVAVPSAEFDRDATLVRSSSLLLHPSIPSYSPTKTNHHVFQFRLYAILTFLLTASALSVFISWHHFGRDASLALRSFRKRERAQRSTHHTKRE